jgi:hypothetical protein
LGKVLFHLLQAASHSEHPEFPPPDLRHERLTCGITETNFDNALTGSKNLVDLALLAIGLAGIGFGRLRAKLI